MKRFMPPTLLKYLLVLLGATVSVQAAQANGTAAHHFEQLRALELQSLEARAAILAKERTCIQAATTYGHVKDCRSFAKAERDSFGREVKPQYEALTPRPRVAVP